jgi:hypothetical protein
MTLLIIFHLEYFIQLNNASVNWEL